MVLTADEFEEVKELPKGIYKGRNQILILEYLSNHKDEAFSQKELVDNLNIKHSAAVNSALHALHRQEKITCRIVSSIQYWKVNEV